MRIALAHDHLFQVGGAERVLRALADMFPQAPIYTLIAQKGKNDFFSDRQIKTSFLQGLPGGTRFFKLYLSLMPAAWEAFEWSQYDVIISSSSAFVKGIVTGQKNLHICYCHSPIRYLWSDSFDYVRSLRLPKIAEAYLHHRLSELRTWDQIAAQRPDFFISNSQFIRERIKKYYGRDSHVIYPPVDTKSFTVSDDIQKYFLVVSRLRPYKRVDLAVEAFNHLKLPLLIIGDGEEATRLKKIAKKNIRFLGEVSDARRNYYISRCRALIYPQIEDFGISAVEAMASGRPVIAYGEGGARETILPGKTGIFFDQQSWESLAYAVLTFRSEDYDSFAIREYAQKFDTLVFKKEIELFVSNARSKKNNDRR